MSAPNKKELGLMERAAIHILSRAIRNVGKAGRKPTVSQMIADQDAKQIMSSCAAAIFHGGEPRRAQKKAGVA